MEYAFFRYKRHSKWFIAPSNTREHPIIFSMKEIPDVYAGRRGDGVGGATLPWLVTLTQPCAPIRARLRCRADVTVKETITVTRSLEVYNRRETRETESGLKPVAVWASLQLYRPHSVATEVIVWKAAETGQKYTFGGRFSARLDRDGLQLWGEWMQLP